MAKYPGFVGGSYQSRSRTLAADRTYNLFFETAESQTGKNQAGLYGRPGTALFGTLATSPVRGLWVGDERLFAVAGSKLYEVFDDGSSSELGDVGDDAGHSPAQIFPNGNQLLIVSAGLAYVHTGDAVVAANFDNGDGTVDTSGTAVTWVSGDQFDSSLEGNPFTIAGTDYTVDTVTDATHLTLTSDAGTQTGATYGATSQVTAKSGCFLDGYYIVSKPQSKQFNISALYDGKIWDPVDFAIKEGYPDNIAGILADHEELWLGGDQTMEVWRNTGNADFPFERDPGAFIHEGVIAWATLSRLADGVAWLGGDPEGWPIAFRAQGYVPQRISTHAIEKIWSGYGQVTDAESFEMVLEGHSFWVLTFPSGPATWVYDATTKYWFEWGDGTTSGRWKARGHGFVFGKHLVGDYASGNIYEVSTELFDDSGTAFSWERAAPHLSDENRRTFFSEFRLDMEQADDLTLTLELSNNGGKAFGSAKSPSGAQVANGDSSVVVSQRWSRCGASRDRVFRVRGSATSRVCLVDAYLDTIAGS